MNNEFWNAQQGGGVPGGVPGVQGYADITNSLAGLQVNDPYSHMYLAQGAYAMPYGMPGLPMGSEGIAHPGYPHPGLAQPFSGPPGPTPFGYGQQYGISPGMPYGQQPPNPYAGGRGPGGPPGGRGQQGGPRNNPNFRPPFQPQQPQQPQQGNQQRGQGQGQGQGKGNGRSKNAGGIGSEAPGATPSFSDPQGVRPGGPSDPAYQAMQGIQDAEGAQAEGTSGSQGAAAGDGQPKPGWSKKGPNLRKGLEMNVKRTIYICDIYQDASEEELANIFNDCGEVVDCRLCGDPSSSLRFAFIEFAEPSSVEVAMRKSGTLLGDIPIRCMPSKTAIVPVNSQYLPQNETEREQVDRTVYVASIDKRVEKIDVKNFFESVCGPVAKLRLLGDSHHAHRIAFIEFKHADSAVTALSCSGALLGSIPIRVYPSKTPVRSGREKKKRDSGSNPTINLSTPQAAAAAAQAAQAGLQSMAALDSSSTGSPAPETGGAEDGDEGEDRDESAEDE